MDKVRKVGDKVLSVENGELEIEYPHADFPEYLSCVTFDRAEAMALREFLNAWLEREHAA